MAKGYKYGFINKSVPSVLKIKEINGKKIICLNTNKMCFLTFIIYS